MVGLELPAACLQQVLLRNTPSTRPLEACLESCVVCAFSKSVGLCVHKTTHCRSHRCKCCKGKIAHQVRTVCSKSNKYYLRFLLFPADLNSQPQEEQHGTTRCAMQAQPITDTTEVHAVHVPALGPARGSCEALRVRGKCILLNSEHAKRTDWKTDDENNNRTK